jgi:hypothetical protein
LALASSSQHRLNTSLYVAGNWTEGTLLKNGDSAAVSMNSGQLRETECNPIKPIRDHAQ